VKKQTKEDVLRDVSKLVKIEDKKCPFCRTQMEIRRTWLRVEPYAARVILKCPKCFSLQKFGVPISEEEFLRRIKSFGEVDVALAAKEEKPIERRFKALGYLG
jgi:phage FluMu protein Com